MERTRPPRACLRRLAVDRSAQPSAQPTDRVARFLLNISKRLQPPIEVQAITVNLQPAFLATLRGRPLTLTVLGVDGNGVRDIRIIVNPDKLRAFRDRS